jgi:diguanylate cyclase (GGDEF)-like protein
VVAPTTAVLWGGPPAAIGVLALVFGDVILVAASLGALATVGFTRGRNFAVWALGMLVFTVGDLIFASRLAAGTYEQGTWLDSLWVIGLSLIAVGATTRAETQAAVVPPARSLVVVVFAALAAVVVLVIAPDWRVNPVPTLISVCALVGCGVRLGLAFLQLRELAVVREQALTDELTGVGNRRALYRRLDVLLGDHVAEEPGSMPGFSLALVDLDHFKEVNDSFGHGTGDELLKAVAARFVTALRNLGTPHLLVRLGGDEFAVVLEGVDSKDSAMGCGAVLQESLREPITLNSVLLHVRASIGVAMAPQHASSRGDILFAADAAMYDGKSSGEMVNLYSPTAVGDRRNRLEVAEDLYSALERDELVVEYQPVLTVEGEVVGAEALVRWDHPVRGRLMPDEFLPVAERYRLTPEIAQRVLDITLTDLQRWRLTRPDLQVSVNVSATDLQNERLVELVASALLRHGVPSSALTVEVTETAMMRDPHVAQSVMQALDELGVRLSVDDYGTGYSSLEYLLKLPINEIKLDRAFSMDLVHEVRSVAIVRSTIDLTHALGLKMVAEGVENQETLVILRDLGCDLVQGWHFGRSTSAADFERFVATHPAPRPLTAER